MQLGALLVDFDGTACLQDVSEMLLDRFGEPGWERFDEAVDRGEMGLREAARHQAAMLHGTPEEMLAFALAEASLDPTFPPFVAWAEEREIPITLASDGFGFYVRPILEAAGLERLDVVTNELAVEDGRVELRNPNGHPECVGCGTCKMRAAIGLRERHGAVAFVGEGQSDRYGALYSDVVFAKDALVRICEQDGVRFQRWETFDDVRDVLERGGGGAHMPRPVRVLTTEPQVGIDRTLTGATGDRDLPRYASPDRCPGWRDA
jgi:2-hydroxy-3-keto-5-methylthiopentenyl-1-phosphate phosphatase